MGRWRGLAAVLSARLSWRAQQGASYLPLPCSVQPVGGAATATAAAAAAGKGRQLGWRAYTAKGAVPPGLTPPLVPAAQALTRVVVATATPATGSVLWLSVRSWFQYAGLGTFATGAGLVAESHRRSVLPEICSSHGRSSLMESQAGLATDVLAHVQRSARLTARGLYLAALFAPVTIMGLLVYAFPAEYFKACWYTLLRHTLEHAGSAFIKWGQWASTRTDVFPVALCEELSHLHSGAPVHSFKFTQAAIESELGQPLEQLFSEFSREPVASGSVAQVYKAAYDGKPVAVKVRHPGVEQQIRDDFTLLQSLVTGVADLEALKWLNLEESLQQFSHTMADQVMLDAEARHLTRFIHLFYGRRGVSFPVPCYPLVTPGVLVESFEFATCVTDSINDNLPPAVRKYIVRQVDPGKQLPPTHATSQLGSLPPSESKAGIVAPAMCLGSFLRPWPYPQALALVLALDLAMTLSPALSLSPAPGPTLGAGPILGPIPYPLQGTQIYLQMLLADNFMHADLHPGNILLRKSKSGVPPQLVLVDAGMVAQLEKEEQENFIGLFQAIGAGDGAQAAEHILRFTREQTCTDVPGFVADMAVLFGKSCKGYHTGVDIGEVVRGCLNVVRDHRVRVDANYATLLVNVLCIEGLGRKMMPDYNILDSAKFMLEAHRFLGTQALAYLMPLWSLYSGVADELLWMRHKTSPTPVA
eukprot:CAMPEP_0117684700 /NCGR_PEP_ID=MMETSP0804-20121206/21266_1 /TAXON_ID=1074897 /ORGANISM="Tetraselmis astigmatica, Strain CCMP880" /LENGTH=700 /DNA_ID=CAMNT_0005495763 /DNA_START=140 /DNA_END=2240 /DNA_ORIENTATION=+